MEEIYKKTIKDLQGSSKELFDALNYILQDQELALGYLGVFEMIVKKSEINAKIDVLVEVFKEKDNENFSLPLLIGRCEYELLKLDE